MPHHITHKTDLSTIERLNRAQKELSFLYELSNAMRTTLELNHILHIILTGVTSHVGLGFNRAILFLVDEHNRNLAGTMAIGPDSGEQANEIWQSIKQSNDRLEDLISPERTKTSPQQSSLNESIKKLKIPLNLHDGGLLAEVYHHGLPMHIDKTTIAQKANDPVLQIFKTQEMVLMPLKAKNKVEGLIIADNIYTQKPITQDDLNFFAMLANQAGLAIENSQLYEMVVHKSHTDSITGLWNHGYFQYMLALEIEKARKNKTPLSLAIIDIDNFKSLNDTYGHPNGDLILTEIASIIKNSSRDADYVCRYGGEEFSVILTQINKEQSFEIAQRIRKKIEEHYFPKFDFPQDLRITVSIGLATFPDDADSKDELIIKADKAMYIAKFSGKNQVVLSNPQL